MSAAKTPTEIALHFAELLTQKKEKEAQKLYWSDDVQSFEPMDGPMAKTAGRAAVVAKGVWWYENHEVHSSIVSGPYVHGEQFMLGFDIDVTAKTGPMAGKRMQMKEVGLYTLKAGKIIEERFFYGVSKMGM